MQNVNEKIEKVKESETYQNTTKKIDEGVKTIKESETINNIKTGITNFMHSFAKTIDPIKDETETKKKD